MAFNHGMENQLPSVPRVIPIAHVPSIAGVDKIWYQRRKLFNMRDRNAGGTRSAHIINHGDTNIVPTQVTSASRCKVLIDK